MRSKDNDFEPTQVKMTTWYNPHPTQACTVVLMIQHGSRSQKARKFQYVIPPKGKVEISSEFDEAIRTEDGHGNVLGGLAPWLKKGEHDATKLPAVLDWITQQEAAEFEAETKKVERDNARKAALAIQEEKRSKKV